MISSKDSIVISPQLLGKEASKSAIAREAEQAGTSSGSKAEERKNLRAAPRRMSLQNLQTKGCRQVLKRMNKSMPKKR